MLNRKPKRDGYLPLASPPSTAAGINTTGGGGSIPIANGPRSSSVPGLTRRASPTIDQKKQRSVQPVANRNVIATGQLAQPTRQKDKFVYLPEGAGDPVKDAYGQAQGSFPTLFEDLEELETEAARGPIGVYCISEGLSRETLDATLKQRYPQASIHSYPDAVHITLAGAAKDGLIPGDALFFNYGVVICWGLSKAQELEIVNKIASPARQVPLSSEEVEVDRFEYHYSAHERPNMQNDTITVNRRQAADHQVKLAISHALAQSTKLCVYEERVVEIVLETKQLPEALAKYGSVNISSKKVAQLIGKVFLQRSTVNLVSTALDTPEFFWSAPDHLQELYEKSCEYLELEGRLEVLNTRFGVLQDMLDMLRDHQNNSHSHRLEWIIIWLIVIEVVIGLLELGFLALLGL